MAATPKRIEVDLAAAGKAKILIDGEEVKNAKAITIRAAVDEPTVVSIDFIGVEAKVTAKDATVESNEPQTRPIIFCETCGLSSETGFSRRADGAHRVEGAEGWCHAPLDGHTGRVVPSVFHQAMQTQPEG